MRPSHHPTHHHAAMSENFYNDTWSDNFPLDYDVAHSVFLDASIVFGVLWSVAPICLTVSGHLTVSSGHVLLSWFVGWLSLLFLFIGSMVMTKYCVDAGVAHRHDYLGPMRVKGTKLYQRETVKGCNGGDTCGGGQGFDNCCFYHEFAVKVELEWGYDWACPQHGKKCLSVDTYEPCSTAACKTRWPSATCQADQLQNAKMDAQDCAEMLYPTDWDYPKYDAHDPPGSDWPTWLAFGDCSTCTSRFIVPSDNKIRHLKVAGCIFILFGLTMWIVLLIRWIRTLILARQNGRIHDHESRTAILQSEQTTNYDSYSPTAQNGDDNQGNGRMRYDRYSHDDSYQQGFQNAVYCPDFDY